MISDDISVTYSTAPTPTPSPTATPPPGGDPISVAQSTIRVYNTSNTITLNLAGTPSSGQTVIAVIGARVGALGTIDVSSVMENGVLWQNVIYENNPVYMQTVAIWAGLVEAGASRSI